MRNISKEEIKKIIEDHQHFLNKDCEGWKNMRADFSYVNLDHACFDNVNLFDALFRDSNLRNASFIGANLSNADLSGVDAYNANFSHAGLIGVDAYNANFSHADLRNADLSCSNLNGIALSYADLRNADLSHTTLSYAILTGAHLNSTKLFSSDLIHARLDDADLSASCLNRAHLSNAYLYNTNLMDAAIKDTDFTGAFIETAKSIPFIPMACPEEGSFIGFKKAGDYIIKLSIPEDAKRSSAVGRKCRYDKAIVLEIQNMNGERASINSITSDYDPDFVYTVGEEVTADSFDENRWNECAPGIHFFINRQEAVDYQN